MQYPIIDNVIYAYQRNGWTGLELVPGINLFNKDSGDYQQNNFYIDANGSIQTSVRYRTSNYIPIEANEPYFWAINGVPPVEEIIHSAPRFAYYDIDYNWIVSSDTLGAIGTSLEAPSNAAFIRVPIFVFVPNTVATAMLVKGTTIPTTYEPYKPPTTDIDKRLKLPMIHYFPHPVIDALQRAAAGNQTADDTEVLRHYLTPLGIGGI